MDITFNNYTECMRVSNELDKEYILIEHIKLYNEMNSFINGNITELDYDSKLYTEKATEKGKKWYEKVWDWIKKTWGKIVKFFTDIFNKIKTFFTGNKKKLEETKKEVEKNKEKIKEQYENSSVSSYVSAAVLTTSATLKAASPLATKDTTNEDNKIATEILDDLFKKKLLDKKYIDLTLHEKINLRKEIYDKIQKIQNKSIMNDFSKKMNQIKIKLSRRKKDDNDLFNVLSDYEYLYPNKPLWNTIEYNYIKKDHIISNIQSCLDLADLNNAIYTFFLTSINKNSLANTKNWMYIDMDSERPILVNCVKKFDKLSTLESYKEIFKIEKDDKIHDEYISVMSSLRYILEILTFEIICVNQIFYILTYTTNKESYEHFKDKLINSNFTFFKDKMINQTSLNSFVRDIDLFDYISKIKFNDALTDYNAIYGEINNPNFNETITPSSSFMNFFKSILESMIDLLKLINDSSSLVNKSTNEIFNNINTIIKSDNMHIQYLKSHERDIKEG